MMLTLGLLTPLFVPSTVAPPSTSTQPALRSETDVVDRPEWRDRSRPQLRKHWDALEGKPAPSLGVLTDWVGGDALTWEGLRGKVVLIDMWATWCAPCKAQFPHLKKLYAARQKDGLEIVGVHSARGWEKQAAMVSSQNLPWAFAADKRASLGSALGVQFIPCYFVVDKKGVMRVAGADRNRVDDIIDALLAEPYSGPAPDVEAERPEPGGWPKYVEKDLYAEDFRGKKAPAFAVESWVTDEPSFEGKVVLYDFWATWCPPCRKSIPELNELQAEFKDDLVIVGITDEDTKTIERFMQKTKMAYSVAVDSKRRMSTPLRIAGIPHVLIVSTDGVVRWQGFPSLKSDPLTADLLRSIIDNDPGVKARRAQKR